MKLQAKNDVLNLSNNSESLYKKSLDNKQVFNDKINIPEYQNFYNSSSKQNITQPLNKDSIAQLLAKYTQKPQNTQQYQNYTPLSQQTNAQSQLQGLKPYQYTPLFQQTTDQLLAKYTQKPQKNNKVDIKSEDDSHFNKQILEIPYLSKIYINDLENRNKFINNFKDIINKCKLYFNLDGFSIASMTLLINNIKDEEYNKVIKLDENVDSINFEIFKNKIKYINGRISDKGLKITIPDKYFFEYSITLDSILRDIDFSLRYTQPYNDLINKINYEINLISKNENDIRSLNQNLQIPELTPDLQLNNNISEKGNSEQILEISYLKEMYDSNNAKEINRFIRDIQNIQDKYRKDNTNFNSCIQKLLNNIKNNTITKSGMGELINSINLEILKDKVQSINKRIPEKQLKITIPENFSKYAEYSTLDSNLNDINRKLNSIIDYDYDILNANRIISNMNISNMNIPNEETTEILKKEYLNKIYSVDTLEINKLINSIKNKYVENSIKINIIENNLNKFSNNEKTKEITDSILRNVNEIIDSINFDLLKNKVESLNKRISETSNLNSKIMIPTGFLSDKILTLNFCFEDINSSLDSKDINNKPIINNDLILKANNIINDINHKLISNDQINQVSIRNFNAIPTTFKQTSEKNKINPYQQNIYTPQQIVQTQQFQNNQIISNNSSINQINTKNNSNFKKDKDFSNQSTTNNSINFKSITNLNDLNTSIPDPNSIISKHIKSQGYFENDNFKNYNFLENSSSFEDLKQDYKDNNINNNNSKNIK